jgi:hypothetical protein
LDYKRQAADAESACKAAQNECDTLKKDIAELKMESKGSVRFYYKYLSKDMRLLKRLMFEDRKIQNSLQDC